MLKIDLGYPTIDQEVEILDLYSSDAPLETLQEVADSNDVLWMREQALHVHCASLLKDILLN